MLFTTAPFLLAFLPLTLVGFFLLGRFSHRAAAAWLALASLFFYGWWMPELTWLLLGSIGMNYLVGQRIAAALQRAAPGAASRAAWWWLVAGVVADLGLLGYFKYANFLLDNLALVSGQAWSIEKIVLPIGISFYTFTQIAFLVDTYRAKVHEARFVHYGLFVTYFPHLIAGPVLHHAQMMPQFADPAIYRFQRANFAAGLAIFALGLLKKVVLADGVAPYADAVFNAGPGAAPADLVEAWLAAMAYTLQLYFDFSGYSDMAIGLSWMFNVRLPFNFDSPYRATSISDFWRRWHISLSNFLRDYLYIALGGNRLGAARRYANLAITMVLGGLWHGANWTFVVWGTLHGAYLMVNHGFRAWCGPALTARLDRSRAWALAGWAMTLLAVVLAWVFFRAHTLADALAMLRSMAGLHGLQGAQGVHGLLWNAGLQPQVGAWWCAVLGAVAFLAPNTNRIGERLHVAVRRNPVLAAAVGGFAAAQVLLLLTINTARDAVSAFIYFNF